MTEVFERLCPYYMTYGMTYHQYWHGDPWAMKAYKQAYMLWRKQENEMLWLGGAYFMNAFSVVLGNAFSKKGTPPRKYLEQPLDVFPKTEAEEMAEQEAKQRKLIAGLTAWKQMFDAAKKE